MLYERSILLINNYYLYYELYPVTL